VKHREIRHIFGVESSFQGRLVMFEPSFVRFLAFDARSLKKANTFADLGRVRDVRGSGFATSSF
jgi:hypothetical protein